jgi:hypothetical protein
MVALWNEASKPCRDGADRQDGHRQDHEGEPLKVGNGRSLPSVACASPWSSPAALTQIMAPIATECTVMLAPP